MSLRERLQDRERQIVVLWGVREEEKGASRKETEKAGGFGCRGD